MAFTWATSAEADVQEPSSGLKLLGYVSGQKPTAGNFNWLFQQVADISGAFSLQFQAIGHLPSMIGADMGAELVVRPLTISAIRIICPNSPASGDIEVELFRVTPGGSPATLYTSNPLPVLACNGGYAAISSPNLPDVLSIAAGDLLIARIVAAPGDSVDLKVMVF